MRDLMEKKPVLHAVVWIMLYVAVVNMGDALSEKLNTAHLGTAALLAILSLVLILYIRKGNCLDSLGVKRTQKGDLRKVLFYLPMILLAVLQFFPGIDPSLSTADIVIICILMIGTGFIEEVIFRGFLLRGIQAGSGLVRAILISGVTFGIGHIVNLFRGYGYAELSGQILAAVAAGIALALLAALTGKLLPGILFHIVFNISGSLSRQDSSTHILLLAVMLAITLPYAAYLFVSLKKNRGTGEAHDGSGTMAAAMGSFH